ncbi:POK9 protein, partial [Dicaeum eximium]|nr:POK9 protein [Dicaeum eximium]
MAASFAAMKGPSGVCFDCDKPGHLKKDCLAQKRNKSKALEVCPQCHKGHHFTNECCSKYDSEGCLIYGNQNWSTERRRAQTQMLQPPPQMPALQMQPPQMRNGGLPQVFT